MIYEITKNGEGDGVFMNIDAFEKREQALELRAKIMQAEEERISGARTRSIEEARKEYSIYKITAQSCKDDKAVLFISKLFD